MSTTDSRGRSGLSADARRIRWTLNGPLETSIFIVQLGRQFDPDEVPEPYFLGYNGDREGNPTWHPFSQSPLTERKVSSTKLFVDPLDEWDYWWMEGHEHHTEPDQTHDPADVLYEPCPPSEAYPEGSMLVRCCGEDRPHDKGTGIVVKGTGDGGFVTIHDFLSVVHPYLMSRRDEVLEAMALDGGRPGKRPFGPESKLIVTYNPAYVDVQTEAEFMRNSKKYRGTVRSIVSVSGPGHLVDVDVGGAHESQVRAPVGLWEAALAQAAAKGFYPPPLPGRLARDAARAAAEKIARAGPPDSTPGGA